MPAISANVDWTYLIDAVPYDPGTAGTVNVYMATRPVFFDANDVTASNRVYRGCIGQAMSVKRGFLDTTIEGTVIPGGLALPTFGAITIIAGDEFAAERAAFKSYRWSGRRVTVRRGIRGEAFSTYSVLFDGFCSAEPDFEKTNIVLPVSDIALRLSKPFQSAVYSGAGGFNGGDDLKGKPKHDAVGVVRGAEGVWVDEANGWLDVCASGFDIVLKVTDGADEVDADASDPPAAGDYYADLVNGRLRFSSPPNKVYRVDFISGFAGGSVALGTILSDIHTDRAGYLGDLPRTNLILQSQTIDNGSWQKGGVSVAANSTAAPDGTTTAEKVTEDGSAGNHYFGQTAMTVVASSTNTFSIHLKPINRTRFQLMVIDGGGSHYFFARFNLSTAAVTSSGVGGSGTFTASTVESVGGGWYRISIAGIISSATSATAYVNLLDASGNPSFTGTSTDSVYPWGAQVEPGAAPTAYIPTTTAAVTVYDERDIDTSAFTALDSARPEDVGYYVRNGESCRDVCEGLIGNAMVYLTQKPSDGQVTCGIATAPTATAETDAQVVLVITDRDIAPGSFKRKGRVAPPYALDVKGQRNWLVLSDDQIAAAAVQADKDFARQEWRTVPKVNSTTETEFPFAKRAALETAFDDLADLDSFGDDAEAVLTVPQPIAELSLVAAPFGLNLGDEVWVRSVVNEIDAPAVVGEIDERTDQNLVKLRLYGLTE